MRLSISGRNWLARAAALFFGAGLLLALSAYPLEHNWLAALLLAYAGVLAWRSELWLFALPALLPVLDLAPRTGWFFLEEIDLLLLITASVCYWNLPRENTPAARLPAAFSAWLMLLSVSLSIGLWRGLQPLPPVDANAFTNYLSPYNALRIGKAWLWSWILLPPLRRAAGPQLEGLQRYLVPGMMTGLLLVACAAIQERWLFPGLLNFSSDYRTTAPFSAMHTGGAALDGYLALSFPLLAMWWLGRPSMASIAALLILLPLALYAGLTTFSRGLYAAYAGAAVILLSLPAWRYWQSVRSARSTRVHRGDHQPWSSAGHKPRLSALAALLAAILALLTLDAMFRVAGYRGFGAAVVLLAVAVWLSLQRLRPALLASGLACGLAVFAMLVWLLPISNDVPGLLKAPYLLFMVSALMSAAAAVPALPAPLGRGSAILPLALFGFSGLTLATGWIAMHWGGPATLAASTGVALLALLLVGLGQTPIWPPQPLQQVNRRSLAALLALLLASAWLVPIANGYYVSQRFSTSKSDLASRFQHWRHVLSIMDDGGAAALLGMGLGKFPSTYFWRNPGREVPASYRYLDQGHNRSLQLSTGDYAAGYGELLRILQTVQVGPDTDYLLGLDVMNGGAPAFLHVNLCERQLLYQQNCIPLPLRQIKPGPYWQRYQYALNSGVLGRGAWPWRARVQLEIAAEGSQAMLDIDNVSLRDSRGQRELIRNGSFSDANNYWFFSSDRHHLPWHVKNLGLNLYFELGLLGLLSFAGSMLTAFALLLRRAWLGDAKALVWLAALAGFHVVGLFDSLLDVPRITLLFLLLLSASVLQAARLPSGIAPSTIAS